MKCLKSTLKNFEITLSTLVTLGTLGTLGTYYKL
jgi:hypothetical protein